MDVPRRALLIMTLLYKFYSIVLIVSAALVVHGILSDTPDMWQPSGCILAMTVPMWLFTRSSIRTLESNQKYEASREG